MSEPRVGDAPDVLARRYPRAAQVLEALADDPSVSPGVFEQVCEAVFDVADRHIGDEPGPLWR